MGMGNPLLDMVVDVDMDILQKYGVQLDSAILAEERHLAIYDELAQKYKVQYVAGGAVLNSVRVAQWMLGAPGATSYVGCVGVDSFGTELKKCARADGITAYLMEDFQSPTGTCAVLVHGGERSLIANLGAANDFLPQHLQTDPAKRLIDAAQYYYVAGFFLTPTYGLDSILHMAKHAVQADKIFMLNLSAPFLIQFFQDQMAAALPYCDFVFGNESEATTFGEVKGWGNDIGQVALKIAALPKASGTRPRIVVITQGPNPTYVACQGKVMTFPVEPLPNELLVDTNGAGDSFCGGFIAHMIKGEPLSDCVRAGHWAARTVIQHSGCTFPKVCDYV